ncbi:MAG: site-specific DNA-methyltransferase [Gammaproteobacteria bacterium]|nr:site-specific DNA-methyltransferase [Gammaproteobacteria bacterium]
MSKIDLYKGDCLEVMDELISQNIVVDAIITDPPYGTTACKWDSVIPFPEMWEQLNKLIKSNGAIVLFGSEPFSSALRMSNIKNYKYDWVWKKTKPTGFSHSKNMPLKDFELVSVFSNSSIGHKKLLKNRMEYNPQGVFKCERKIKRNKKGFEGSMERKSQTNEYIGELSGFPKMVLEFNNVISKKTSHPTQKPVALMEYLIKTYTNEGELVLDFTMGSGTTGVACKNLGRNFIGIEMNDGYFDMAKKRIEDTVVEKG